MQNITDITEKKYKKLAIKIALDGFSFCIIDLINHNISGLKNVSFFSFSDSNLLENAQKTLADNFKLIPELTEKYDEIEIIYANNLSTFVPTALFDEDYLGSYLQYNNKVFETDFFAFDTLENYQMNCVYIPYINFNNFFIDQYGSFNYKHSSSILVSKILDLSKNNDTKKMFVHIESAHFEIVVVKNQKLLLYNSYDYKTPEDLIYYILFTAEQLDMNPENLILEMIGKITDNDELFKICFKYIRNVSFMHVNFLRVYNNYTEVENRTNFILFNS